MTSEATLRILLVGEGAGQQGDIHSLLDGVEGWTPEILRAEGYADGLQRLEEGGVDVALVHHDVDGASGMDFLRDERARLTGVPLILLTEQGRRAELEAAAAGAADSLSLAELSPQTLERALRYAVEAHRRSRAERLSQALLENSRDLITVLGPKGTVEFVSPSVTRILGVEPGDRMGDAFRDGVHPDDQERLRQGLERLMEDTGGSWSFRCRARHSDGSWRVLDSRAQNLLQDPMVRGVVVNSWDVTDLARAEEALREREELLARVVASLPMIIFALDGDGVFTLSEGKGLAALGLEPGQVVGAPVWELYAERPAILEDVRRAMAGESFRSVRRVEDRVFEIWWSPLTDTPGIMGVTVDVTERTEAEARQRRLLDVIDHSPDFIGIATADRTVEHLNPAGRRLTGLGPDREVRGLPVSTFHPDWAMERLETEAFPAALRHTVWRGENALLAADGSEIRVWQVIVAHRTDSGEVSFFSTVASDLREQERAAERIRFQATLLNAVGQAVIATDLEGRVTYWNRAAEKLYGWTQGEAAGRSIMDLTAAGSDRLRTGEILQALRDGGTWTGEFRVRRKDGTEFPALVTNAPLRNRSGEIVGMVGVSQDLSRQKSLETELREAQKMEAIGRLAGGIAHDFNNLLTAIRGHVDLLLQDLEADSPHRPDLREVERAATRAADLTRQLLAFSRRQVFEERTLDLRTAISEMEGMLVRLIPETITLSVEVPGEPALVRADPTQIHQVALNLVLNAVDAMPDGGSLDVRVERIEEADGAPVEIRADVRDGAWISLSVSDSGVGMTEDVKDRVFEPFFTTKEVGKGTGLGLATVFGIVKQSGGEVVVRSKPWEGSVFQVLLPAVEGAEEVMAMGEPLDRLDPGETVARGSETVLVVEDDDAVRRFTTRVLRRAGFGVVEARNGLEAISIADGYPWPIDLVLSDVVMPEMGGGELVERLRESYPGVRVVLISGYAREELPTGLEDLGVPLLAKPFEIPELMEVIRTTLDR